jgi:hypothetical protein
VATLCSVMDQNSSLKSLSLENNRVSPDTIADLFEAIANPNNGLIELRVASQVLYKKAYIAWLHNSGVFSIIADLLEAITLTPGSSSAWLPRYWMACVAWLLQNNRISPDTIADLFEAIAKPNNGLIELRVASQVLEGLCCLVVAKQLHFS